MAAPSWLSRSRFDFATNVIVVVTCLLICALAAHRWIERGDAQRVGISAMPPVYPPGFQLSESSGIEFGRPTVLVGLSSQCGFCAQSIPQLRRLNKEWSRLSRGHGHLVAVGAEASSVLATYLKDNGLSAFEVHSVTRTSELAAVATRTPSVVLLDSTGAVLASWPGLITADRMAEVLQRVEAAFSAH